MAPTIQQAATQLAPRQYYVQTGPNYTTWIIIVCVIIGIKILMWGTIVPRQRRKRAERWARGCHCYDRTCCPAWWNDNKCHCAQDRLAGGVVPQLETNGAPIPMAPPVYYPPHEAGDNKGAPIVAATEVRP